MEPITRRTALAGLGGGALAVALAACKPFQTGGPTATTFPLAANQATLGQGAFTMINIPTVNQQTGFVLGAAGMTSAPGEVAAIVAQVNQTPGGFTYDALFDAFIAMGNQLQEQAVKSQKAKHPVSARSQFLRAASYYNQALFWVLGTTRHADEGKVYTTMNDCFVAATKSGAYPAEPIEIKYEKSSLPGWFIKPVNDTQARPTVIFSNGVDGQNIDMYAQGGFAALERGYNILLFEGPGQGSNLFLKNIPFRPDWQAVITPVVDYLATRKDVNQKQIALRGISFSGLLAPQAAAFEHRIAALIADPGDLSTFLSYPPVVQATAKGTPEQVNAAWQNVIIANTNVNEQMMLRKTLSVFTKQAHEQAVAGQIPSNWYDLSRVIQQYNITDVAKNITCPTLVTQYQGDTSFTNNGQKLYDLLTVKQKTLHEFTSVNGAQGHCGPLNPEAVAEVMWDWLDETFGR